VDALNIVLRDATAEDRPFLLRAIARLRLSSRANDDQAIRAYHKAGFATYEIVFEKRL
jgi:ribosomal protein S18 acetylase RimI-like enzyme